MKAFIICLLAAVAAHASPTSELRRPRRLTVGLGKHRKHEGTLNSYKRHLTTISELRDSADITLQDVQDMYYFGPMTVGTKPQTIQVMFDSGSGDLWLPSRKLCRKYYPYCRHHNTYNHKKSSTYHKNGKPFSIQYGSGAVSGVVSQDNVVVGGLTVVGQLFGEATAIEGDIESLAYDSMLGLAYSSLSEIGTDPPFVNMIKQGLVEQPVFAFYLNKERSGETDANETAELVLGGVDSSHYTGDFTFAPVTQQKYWMIQIDGILLGKKKICSTYGAVPDSGSSFMIGPTKAMDKINKAIHGTPEGGLYVVDCSKISTFPDVTYVISGKKFTLNPSDYIFKVQTEVNSNDEICFSGFVGNDQLPFVILGDVFMRKYYTQFDMGNNQIGFATAK